MSAKRRVLTVDNLDKWQQGLVKANRTHIEHLKRRIMHSAGLRTLEYVDDFTPARTGRLKGSMSMGDKDNVFEVKVGKKSHIVVGTAVKYALPVNDGHTQKAGRFVPGYWQGDTFVYVPGHDTGMVLTGKVIPGAHMFEGAMQYMEDGDMDTIVDFEFRRLYGELFL